MELFELVLLLLGSVLLSTVFDRILPRLSLPLVQIAIGMVVALVWSENVDLQLDPELFLVMFVAPLLFNESRRSDRSALWDNKISIISLAVGLVLLTMLVVGFVLNWIEPSIPLAAAFALGAALGPTDAVAVTALAKQINMNKRQRALLSGEALINDASGVVGFQFAIAAATTGAFSLLDAGVEFCVLFFGGIVVGLVLGLIATVVLRALRSQGLESTTVHVVVEIFMPFFTFLVAETLNTSGVLAVVTAGLLMTFFPGRHSTTTTRIRIVSSSVWGVLIFIINGIVFVLLGMQLVSIVSPTWNNGGAGMNRGLLIVCVVLLTVVVMGVRFIWILCLDRLGKDEETGKRNKFSWSLARSALATTLSGPKGAVTLSIAFTFPYFLTTAVAFPHRDDLIFLASGVIVLTLLMANYLVPLLVPDKEEEEDLEAEREADIDILTNVRTELIENRTSSNDRAIRTVARFYDERIMRLMQNDVPAEVLLPLRQELLEVQRDCIYKTADEGEVSDEVCDSYDESIDRMEKTLGGRRGERHAKRYMRRRTTMRLRRAVRNLLGLGEKLDSEQAADRYKLMLMVERTVIRYLLDKQQNTDPESEEGIAIEFLLNEHRISLSTLDTHTQENEQVGTLEAQGVNLRDLTGMQRLSPDDQLHTRIVELEAEGFRLELEEIRDMLEEERITPAHAKELREEVYLLQMGLGES